MKAPRIYADTSVFGGRLDEEFAEQSIALLDLARAGRVVLLLSDILAEELESAPVEVQKIVEQLPPQGGRVNEDREEI